MSDHEAEARKVAEEIASKYWGGNPKAGDQVAFTIGRETVTVRQSLANMVRLALLDFLRPWTESEGLYQQEKARHAQTRRDLDQKDHEVAALRAQLAEAVEREKAAEAELGEVRRLWSQTNGALDRKLLAAEARVKELRNSFETLRAMARTLSSPDVLRIQVHKHCEAALQARPEARTPEPKDPLSISYVAVTRGREWPRPEHKRIWNQEQDDSWCSYCHVQWPCDEAKP